MSSSITVVQYPGLTADSTFSPPCAKVHMALRCKRLDYSVKNITTPMEARRYNPRGRVPVLLIDDEHHVDSTDIVTLLDRRFPDPPLEPEDPAGRALAKMLEDWADEVLYFYGLYLRFCVPENFERMKRNVLSRISPPLRWVVPFIARRETARRARAQGVGLKGETVVRREVGECYRAVTDLLGSRPFLVGDRISRADLAVAAVADQHRMALLTPRLAAELNGMPALVAWLERVHEHAPSVVE
jgi:glutathione S-transferase